MFEYFGSLISLLDNEVCSAYFYNFFLSRNRSLKFLFKCFFRELSLNISVIVPNLSHQLPLAALESF